MNLDLSKVSPGVRQDILRAVAYKAIEGAERIERDLENWDQLAGPGQAHKEMTAWAKAARKLAATVKKEIKKKCLRPNARLRL